MCVTGMDRPARETIWKMMAYDSVTQRRCETRQLETKAQKVPGTNPGSPWCWTASGSSGWQGLGVLACPSFTQGRERRRQPRQSPPRGQRGGRRQEGVVGGLGSRARVGPGRSMGAPWEGRQEPSQEAVQAPLITHTIPTAPPNYLEPSPPSLAPASSQAPQPAHFHGFPAGEEAGRGQALGRGPGPAPAAWASAWSWAQRPASWATLLLPWLGGWGWGGQESLRM